MYLPRHSGLLMRDGSRLTLGSLAATVTPAPGSLAEGPVSLQIHMWYFLNIRNTPLLKATKDEGL